VLFFLSLALLMSPATAQAEQDCVSRYDLFAGYTVAVPSYSLTQTLAAGPQLSYRHFKNDILQDGRLATCFSAGPCFNFGKNIKK